MAKNRDAAIVKSYQLAREQYAQWGVNVEAAIRRLRTIPISLQCWQGDDVAGFEGGKLDGGGIQATGNYPGRARNGTQLRADLDLALGLIPGRHRVNIHAIYAEIGGGLVDRDELRPRHFAQWMDWAAARKIGMDFNGTFFSHPKASSGFTLSHPDKGVRRFWIDHAVACREIAAAIGKRTGSPSVCNVWIPDGYKDIPADRLAPRERLKESLDQVFARRHSPKLMLDAVESKLFGIGSESYVVGSHEFYLGYAIANGKLLTLDTGHFHPTESTADKISSVMLYLDRLLLHVSRGIRWDSDHVVIVSDELLALAQELVRGDFLGRTHIGLDFFDASINRIAAWVIGCRSMIKALLFALLEPSGLLRKAENTGDNTSRLAMLEEIKTLPLGAVWDYYCLSQGVPVGRAWLDRVKAYENDVLADRTIVEDMPF
jgi:L-rhamnose isomerase